MRSTCLTRTRTFSTTLFFLRRIAGHSSLQMWKPQLYDYIGGIIRGLGGICLELNGTEDHVHLLAKLRPDCALSDILRELKANATGWMHEVFPEQKDFSWQRGYGAFTVSQSHVEQVSRYIRRQKEHHQKISFRAEFIQYDERYV